MGANDLGVHVGDVAGFFYPRTATGRASLLPAPPWHYSGDLLTVEYRTDPGRVAELLPAPLAPAPGDPGAVALIWADWQSCGDDGAELLDPVRAQYRECFAVVRCSFAGQVYSRCVFIWVDSDFALARGLHQGYPKKLGSIHQTRPHPFGRAAPRIAPGGTFAGTLAAADRRLAQAVVTLREEAETNGFVNAHAMAHHRWLPSIEKGAPDAIVIGRTCRNVPRARAGEYIAGYTIANDFGLHDFRDTDAGSMLRVKGSDTMAPLGPGLVTDWDFRGKRLATYVNGRLAQDGSTDEMHWDVHYLVADIARTITLCPGDVLLSGTPAGSRPVGPGDVVDVEVDGLGRLTNRVIEGPVPVSAELGAQPSESEEVVSTALGGDWEFRGIRPPIRT